MRNHLKWFTPRDWRPCRGPILAAACSKAPLDDEQPWLMSQQLGTFFSLPISPGFVSPTVMDGSGCGIAEASVMQMPALINRTNGTVGVWWFEVKYSHGRNGLVLNSTLNVQRYVESDPIWCRALRPRWWADISRGQCLAFLNLPCPG